MFGHSFRVTDSFDEAPGASSVSPVYELPTPTSASLLLHFDAALGITESGGAISAWEDQINSQSVVQATEASKPLLVEDALNGLPIVRFNGVNQMLQALSMTAGSIQGLTGWSGAVVAQTTFLPGYTNGLLYNWKTSSRVGPYIRLDTPGQIRLGNSSNTTDTWTFVTFTPLNGNPFVVFNSLDLPSVGNEVYLRAASSVEDANVTVGFSGTTVDVSNYDLDQFGIGGRKSAIGFPGSGVIGEYKGDIAEIIIWDGPLDVTDRDAALTYLNGKYAIGFTV